MNVEFGRKRSAQMTSSDRVMRAQPAGVISWLAAAALLLAVAFPSVAFADEPVEAELPDGDVPLDAERPTLEGEDQPGDFDASQFVDEREFEGLQLADEAIVRLRELIDRTPADDPDRAEYLYNLAEKFWQRSRHYDHQAIEQQDECYLLEDEGDEQGARRCGFRVEDMEAESERLREESQDLYIEIIRNYPNFEELDTIYYQLGSNLMELGEEEEALNLFERLLANFPQTPYLPQVLLYFGDYHFDQGDMFEALEAYQKVVQYPDSPVYQYARYRMGWAYFNLDNYERALEEFLTVVDLARAAEEGSADRAMLRQVRSDVVRVYARIGSPDQAVAFFQDIAPEEEDWMAMSENLAIFYGDEAAFADSTNMYNQLIDLNRESYKVLDYQYEIIQNEATINSYSEETLQELGRMLRLIQLAEEGQFTEDEELYPEQYEKIEMSIRNWASTFHREANRTRNESLYIRSHYLYDGYRETFPESEHIYEITYFHGDLLFNLGQWDQAAQAYETVLEMDPDGEHTENAVLNTMLALFEEVDTSEQRAEIEAEFDMEEDSDEPVEIPEPLEMDELEQRLMRASRNYIDYVPDGERIVDVKYTKARTYYDHLHLEEAVVLFEDIAFNHSDHRLAEVSANLHLHTLNMLQDFNRLHEAVEAYIAHTPVDDPEFQEELYELNLAIRYNICVDYDQDENWEDAAQCYLAYVQDFPTSPQADMALYNAALDFERLHEIGMAIQLRRNLLNHFPDSDLAAETMYNIGGNYHAWAIYGEASDFYEQFVELYPDEEEAEGALSNAALFRQGLGHYEQAIENYEKYLELFGSDNPETAAQVFFEIGQIYEEQELGEAAYQHYQEYIRDYGDQGRPDYLLEAHLKIGLHYWNGAGSRADALDVFETVVGLYESMSEEEQQSMVDGRDAAAQAKFMIGEDLFEKAEAIRIDSSDDEELQEITEEKDDALSEAREVYNEVTEIGRPDWTIAALYRIGSGFQDFGEALRESPVPEQLDAGPAEQYKGLIEDLASQFDDGAVELYQGALEAARKASWFNEYSEAAETQLAQLRPADYRQPSELRAQPNFLKDRVMSSPFITDVDDKDLLEEFEDGDIAADDEQDIDEQAADERSDDDEPAS